MKKSKKFGVNCLAVSGKRRNLMANYGPLLCILALLWLIPETLKNNIKIFFSRVQIPVASAVVNLENIADGLVGKTISKGDLIKFCENLLRENMHLRLQLSQVEPLGRNSESAAEKSYIGNFTIIPARVFRRDIATWVDELMVDAGSDHGVAVGMGVISKNCVIGRIKSVTPKTSAVEILTSPRFRMVVHAAGDPTIAPIIFTGCGKNFPGKAMGNAENVPATAPQDGGKIRLVTSSLCGFFPENITVGILTPPREVTESYFSATVTLDSDILWKVREVGILSNGETDR